MSLETAKVDVRKLQILSDRINQTIDALNQVRLSVHGLQHSSGIGVMPQAGLQPQLGLVPFVPQGLPAGYGYAYPIQGIGHTSPVLPGQMAYQGFLPQGAPMASAYGWPYASQVTPMALPFGGISHTSPELDPLRVQEFTTQWAPRYAQTFPYAFCAWSPAIVPGL
jgi:hypothetical protein